MKKLLALLLSGVMALSLVACSSSKDTFSSYLNEDGYLKDIKLSDYVTLPDYKNIEFPSDINEVDKEIIQAEIDARIAQFTTTEQLKEGVIEDGTTYNADYVGTIDGVAFDGGSTNGQGTMITVGKTQLIDDFIEQTKGKKVGDNFDVHVTFPDEYRSPDLQGKDAVFNMTINWIAGEDIVPEFNDEFVETHLKEQLGLSTVKEFKDYLTDIIISQNKATFISEYFKTNTVFKELPNQAIKIQEIALTNYVETMAEQQGVTVNELLTQLNIKDLNELIISEKDIISQGAKDVMMLLAIAEQEGIVANEELIKALYGENYDEAIKTQDKEYLAFTALQIKATEVINTLSEQDNP